MIERWHTFRKQSPFIAGCVLGGVAALLCLLIVLGLTSAKGKFGSAETILVEDYARLMVVEFGQSGDIARARWRYAQLGTDGSACLALLRNDPLTDPATLLNFARAVGDDVLIRGAETAPTLKDVGSPATGNVLLILLIVALTAAGAIFVLTVPAFEKRMKPVRAFLNPILEKVGFSGKNFQTKDRPGDPTIRYRQTSFNQTSFKLNEVGGTSRPEAVKSVSKPIAAALTVEPKPVGTDDLSLIQPPVAESRPAGRASAEFFENVKAQGVKPVDEAVKQVAFTPDDMPEFLKSAEMPKSDPVVEALIEAISGGDEAHDLLDQGSGIDLDDEPAPAVENGSSVDATDEKHDPVTPVPHSELAVSTTRPTESYSVYEAPRRYDRTVESASEFEPDAGGEVTLNGDDWADLPESDAGEAVSSDGAWRDVPEPDAPWNENEDMDEPNAGDAVISDDGLPEVPEPTVPWNEDEVVGELDTGQAAPGDGDWMNMPEPTPWNENEVMNEPAIAQPEEEADDDSWIPHTISGAVQKRTVEINPDLSLPLIQYQAIYQLGDDFFDETFSIDELDDEFIGECGIGIAETINTTEPKAVTAFEAWLFDRQDTVTPTVFLLSDYAYRQPEMLERLKNKGQFELMQVGKKIEVETFALKMTLTISEIIYGTESSDPRSYFDKVVFDVKVTRKEAN